MPLGEFGEGHAPRVPGRSSRDKTRLRLGCDVFVRAFTCPTCGRLVFFENSACLHCGTELAYDAGSRELEALGGRPRCVNAELARCNWLAPEPGLLCPSCARTRTRPADGDAGGLEQFATAEAAKRRLLFELAELGLDPGPELRFDLLSSAHEPVTTGHADGLVTLDLAESGDAHREAMREQMGEPYRTVLGHLRHEVGHHFFPLLRPASPRSSAPADVRRRARGLRRRARAPLRERPARRLGRAPRQRLRDHAPLGGLGGDLRALPAHPRHAADRRAPTASARRSRCPGRACRSPARWRRSWPTGCRSASR